MSIEDRGMAIEELADRVGVPVRTVRYYIAEGLLPGPGTRGKGVVYGEEHLLRLRLIRALVDRRVPLAEVRKRLARLTLAEVRALLDEDQRRAEEQARGAQSPREYISGLLGRARAGRSSPRWPPQAQSPPMGPPPPAFQMAEPRAAMEPAPGGEEWQRWVLAPGLELHVRVDALERYRGLIEQVVRMARHLGSRGRQ